MYPRSGMDTVEEQSLGAASGGFGLTRAHRVDAVLGDQFAMQVKDVEVSEGEAGNFLRYLISVEAQPCIELNGRIRTVSG